MLEYRDIDLIVTTVMGLYPNGSAHSLHVTINDKTVMGSVTVSANQKCAIRAYQTFQLDKPSYPDK